MRMSRPALGLVSMIAIVAAISPAEAQDQRRRFDVNAQPADKGVVTFAKQAGVQILAPGDQVASKQVSAVKGEYTVSDGLRRLTEGTGLEVRQTGARTFTIVPAQAQAAIRPIAMVQAPATPRRSVPLPEVVASGPSAEPASETASDIVVTGIRGSIQNAINSKRDAVSFGDSIFAEDIGKLPATNLAETLNRIPGVRLNRDINGEGTQIAIRGLGPSFSRVLLNGQQFGIASDGGTNGGSANREVDLDFFPSELFTRLDVSKSPTASQLEGGIAGVVNIRNARPFDNPGTHVTLVGQGQYTDSNKKASPRGALVASHTFSDTFGILLGVAGVRTKTRVDGFESLGWGDGNASGSSGGADAGSNQFIYAPTVPANVGRGLTTGAPLTRADLARLSGLSAETLTRALLPRLGRNSFTNGTRERISALASAEWRPSEELHFSVDGMYARSTRDYYRLNMNWQVRNSGPGTTPTSTGGMVPIGLTVDENNVVTSGTFANSSFFLENNIFKQTTKFWNVNPSMTWKPTDLLRVDLSGAYSKSTFFREQPTFAFQTPLQSGVVVNFDNTDQSNAAPVITSNRDLGDPNLGWVWYRVNVQNVRRETETKGAHLDLTYGEGDFIVKVGTAYDRAQRSIRAYDNSTPYQNSVCGTGCAGLTGTLPNSQVSRYLSRLGISNFGHLAQGNVGYTSFIRPDFERIMQATNYAQFRDSAPETRGAVTGGATGDIDEEVYGAYFELNGRAEVFGRDLMINAGMRYAHTNQMVVGPSQIGTSIVDITAEQKYGSYLPSLNLSYSATDRLKLRFAASQSLTRPDASQVLPGLTFSDPSALNASAGNPDLKPYRANNFDLGGEFYTSKTGYVGVVAFRKSIDGFTVQQQTQATFGSLNIPLETLQSTQANALTDRSRALGIAIPNLPVTVTRPVNLQSLRIEGIEATWVQPLDFLIKGLGYQANGTRLKQKSSSGLIAPGVAKWSYNLNGFYENGGLSISLNYVWQGKVIAVNAPQNNLPLSLNADSRGQLDLSSGYQLPFLGERFRLTLDVLNITNEPIRTTFGYSNATYSVYYPGRQILIGVRAKL